MDNLSKFVDVLQDLMNEGSIKPVDLHNATKISQAVIYNWLKKAAVPSTKTLCILSDFFHCTVDYLTGRSNIKQYASICKGQNLSIRLGFLMKSKGVSIRKLSRDTGIAKSSISYFLEGKTEPLLDNLIKLADFFDCTVDFLIGREN